MNKVYIQKRGKYRLSWAVMQEGRKTAIRLFDNLDSAVDYVVKITPPALMHQWIVSINNSEGKLVRQQIKMVRAEPLTPSAATPPPPAKA